MASLFRIGVTRLGNSNGLKSILSSKSDMQLIRCISGKCSKESRGDQPKKPKPWDYKNKSFTLFNYFFDRTSTRFDENSKIIVVEGPLAAGKSAFAKELAEDLEMLYLPEANLDMVYTNHYGYNLKQLDDQLPESCRSFDVNNFLVTPKHPHTTRFQLKQYEVKFSQYIDALAHVFSTGQGVVLDRSVYSDFVFAEAMYKQGYISKLAHKTYYEYRDNTITELMRPHLVIYLDVPVSTVQENIKKRNISCEANSPALTPEYLCTMERVYKQNYLKSLSNHSELLIYDWSEGGEVEIVVEDIERLDFNVTDPQETKFKDWEHSLEDDWACSRYKYADNKRSIMAYFNIPTFHVPELSIDGEDVKKYREVVAEAPGETFEVGYNTKMGDTGLLMKLGKPHRDTLPLTERCLK